MANNKLLEREEYVEQAYFFRILRERTKDNQSTQEALEHIQQEVLATTRLPYALEFLCGELKHSGQLSSGFDKLKHYFTPFQAFVVRGTEEERLRFSIELGLLVLEREAEYRAGKPIAAGLFVYQLEVLSRNRLGYLEGLKSMALDPFYDDNWKAFLGQLGQQLDVVDFADLLYLRSELYVTQQRRTRPDYTPSVPPLFNEKEGRIGQANRSKDPLYLFAALQRHLGYPEVPRPVAAVEVASQIEALRERIRQMEMRLKLVEGEVKGDFDITQFGKPDLLSEE